METKKRLRNWFCRIDTPIPFDWDSIDKTNIRYILGCAHVGKASARPHIHFYLELDKHQRLSWIRNLFGIPNKGVSCCFLPAQEPFTACMYVRQPEKLIGECYEYGESNISGRKVGEQGCRTDLEECKQLLDEGATVYDLSKTHYSAYLRYNKGFDRYVSEKANPPPKVFPEERDVKTIVIWGESSTGKSTAAVEFCIKRNLKYLIINIPPKTDKLWFPSYYNYPDVLILNEFRSQLPLSYMNDLCDKWKFNCQIKNSDRPATWTYVIITSNYDPYTWWGGNPVTIKPFIVRCTERGCIIHKKKVHLATPEKKKELELLAKEFEDSEDEDMIEQDKPLE